MKLVLDCSADSDAIAFPWGLPGLANHRWFHLLRLPQADGWSLLRGEGEPPVALFVVDPWSYFPDYRLQLPFYARLTLELERDEDAAVRCVVVPNDPECAGPSVNLHAPIVINPRTRVARQVLVDEPQYAIHTPITQTKRQEASLP